MDLHKILSDCDTLETTISVLIKDNSFKEIELTRLQDCVFKSTWANLETTLDKERELQCKLDDVLNRRRTIDNEIKQYTTINEKLSELVAVAQKRNSQDTNDDAVIALIEANEEYLKIKLNHTKAHNKLQDLEENIMRDTKEVRNLINENSELLVDLHRNDNLIRLLEQQNKYSEQQFDLVLNQLPWEPITKQCIDDLKASPNQLVKDITGIIQIQANEIEELNESLSFKKKKKLEALENLLAELSQFIQRRDEAVTIAKLND